MQFVDFVDPVADLRAEGEHEEDGTERKWMGDKPAGGTHGRRRLRGELSRLVEGEGGWGGGVQECGGV